ncbi:MAG: hypothetical protein Q9184_005701 [Pyrenodesmia sp. 2 TL-2023]
MTNNNSSHSPVEVGTIKIGDEAFDNAEVTLSHQAAEKVRQSHVQEQPRREGDSILDVKTACPHKLIYCTSMKHIALERIRDENNNVLDIQLCSIMKGEILIERLKLLRVIDCPHTLNDIQARKTLTLKRNLEAASKDGVTPATKRKPYSTFSRRVR